MSTRLEYLQIEPTRRCNYTCGFCAGRHLSQVDMPLQEFKALLDQLPTLKHIQLQGEGEPLLHPDFFAMVQYARQKMPEVKISLITNGSLLRRASVAQLCASRVDTVFISTETVDAQQFQNIRGGKLSRVLRGIKLMMAHKQQQRQGPTLGFAVTLLREAYQQLPLIAQLYHRLGMDGGIMLQPLQTMAAYSEGYSPAMHKNILQAADLQAINNLIASDQPLQSALATFTQASNFYRELYASVSGGCPWLENGLYVSADGLACSCCFIKNAECYAFAHANSSLTGIVQKRQQLAQALYAGRQPAQCRDCSLARRFAPVAEHSV